MGDTTLRELVNGKGAHADPVACVEDIPAELAARTVEGYPHSIWQLVEHMNYWMDYEIRRIEGTPVEYPEHAVESWPSKSGPENDAEWEKTVARFSQLLEKLGELSDSGPEMLNRQVRGNDPVQESQVSTVQTVLWQTAVHNSYHIGQVALLRRCFGAWPPRRGGDTW